MWLSWGLLLALYASERAAEERTAEQRTAYSTRP